MCAVAESRGPRGVRGAPRDGRACRDRLHRLLPDQAALYGVLNRLQALGLDLVEVRRLHEEPPG